MQIGSMIGTVMVANVFFVIIPVQKKLVAACENVVFGLRICSFKALFAKNLCSCVTDIMLFVLFPEEDCSAVGTAFLVGDISPVGCLIFSNV